MATVREWMEQQYGSGPWKPRDPRDCDTCGGDPEGGCDCDWPTINALDSRVRIHDTSGSAMYAVLMHGETAALYAKGTQLRGFRAVRKPYHNPEAHPMTPDEVWEEADDLNRWSRNP